MAGELLEILECPFCGGPLTLDGELDAGVLNCACNAYPIVDGIPYLRNGPQADAAHAHLGGGRRDQALGALLGLDDEALGRLQRAATFAEALAVVCDGPEGDYLLFRFSDPTFVASDTLLRALALKGRVLDVGGGAGHLTRTLARTSDVVLAELSMSKLWLARRFVVPGCAAVCCDANDPLPFAAAAFDATVCCDAFHYIWSKRKLAGELQRAARGPVVLPHLHNQLSWNYSEGMPLPPSGYARLFGDGARVFPETAILEAAVETGSFDLSGVHADDDLGDEPALVLVADPSGALLTRYDVAQPDGELTLNPLYRDGELTFPSDFYEEEYGEGARRYLPERADGLPHDELARRRVLLDLPERYLTSA